MLLSNEQQTDEFVMIRVRGDDDLTQDDEKKKMDTQPNILFVECGSCVFVCRFYMVTYLHK